MNSTPRVTTRRRVCVLGATGSVGKSTLDVLAQHPERYEVFALSGHRRVDDLAELCRLHRPQVVVVTDESARMRLKQLLGPDTPETLIGDAGLAAIASDPRVDDVMAAIVGAAGLRSSLAAARAGKRILLANKESLVCAGELFMAACRDFGASLLPIDSEHNAVFQCLPTGRADARLPSVPAGVTKVILTASGGPFRMLSLAEMRRMTPDQACAHPNWSMGRKISVDSATMMNKGLELIEAHYLFGLPADRLEVIVHPQSIIHSMVEYADGSVLAQLGNPDMRTPIAQALAFPERITSGVGSLQLAAIGRLDFEAPDFDRFPCLALALAALSSGGAAPCVLNAANEMSVDCFLDGGIHFTDIADVNRRVLDALGGEPAAGSIEDVMSLDAQARSLAGEFLKGYRS